MSKFICYCTLTDGDTEPRWIMANSKEEAVFLLKREYWDIESVDFIREEE